MPAWLSVYRSRQKDLARTGRTGERCPARKTWGVDALSLFLTLSLSLVILKFLLLFHYLIDQIVVGVNKLDKYKHFENINR